MRCGCGDLLRDFALRIKRRKASSPGGTCGGQWGSFSTGQKAEMKEWSTHNRFEFTNMDPVMITFMRVWLKRYCGVHDRDVRFRLGIHEHADVRGSLQFWARQLGVAPTEIATWLKQHNPSPKRRNTGSTYHGTMRMEVARSTALSHRIAGWIQAMRVHCGVV